MRQTKLAAVIAAGIFFIGEAAAQNAGGTTGVPSATAVTTTYVSPQALNSVAAAYLRQLGKRLFVPGQESGTITGTFTDSTGSAPLSMVWQSPGLLKLTIQSATSKTLTFNGTAATSNGSTTLSASDQDLLNMLVDDYPEAFFFSMVKGWANRMLGTRFRTDRGNTPDYSGPFYTIYEKVSPLPSTGAMANKMFVFDSASGLLDRVTYATGQGISAEVQFSNWQSIQGERYPGKITRVTSAGTEFTLTFSSASFGPAVPAQTFTAQ